MKRWLLLILACLSCCSSDPDKPGLLFVIQSDSGKIEQIDGDYYFQMNGLAPNMIAFTDRPERKASFIEVGAFVESWGKGKDSFKKDPPNASLSATFTDHENGKQVMHIIEVSHPIYDAKARQIRFKVKSIDQSLPLSDVEVQKVTLFIDMAPIGEDPSFFR